MANPLPMHAKIISCTCTQCRAIKNKRKNRKAKKRIRRYLKRSARQKPGQVVNWYWA